MRRRTLLWAAGSSLLAMGAGLAGAGVAGAGLAGCVTSSSTTDDFRTKIMASWGETLILPGFGALVAAAAALRGAADSFCAAPDASKLKAAQEQWGAARGSFKRLDVFAFGPYSAYPDRLGAKLDFWPARSDSIEEVLADDAPLSAETMSSYGAATRGFPVAEYLLFASGAGSLDAFASSPRRCDYLQAVCGDIEILANALQAAWLPGQGAFLLQLTEPDKTSAYMTIQQAMGEVVNRMWFTIENIRRDKLGRPLGNETNGHPQPDQLESPFSDRSVEDLRDNLSMIEALFEGSDDGMGLIHHPRVKDYPDLVANFRNHLASARGALDDIKEPLDQAVIDEQADVQHAIDVLADLQRDIQVDLIAALSLALSFNDADGD